MIFGERPFVKRFALCYHTVVCPVCPVCLSVTSVHCGQTVRWIKMKLGMQVGLGPGHILLVGDPAPPPQRGTAPAQFSARICSSHHIETTDAGLDGLCIREINVYHTNL